MCQNKYIIQCVSECELLCTLSHVWLFDLNLALCSLSMRYTDLFYLTALFMHISGLNYLENNDQLNVAIKCSLQ